MGCAFACTTVRVTWSLWMAVCTAVTRVGAWVAVCTAGLVGGHAGQSLHRSHSSRRPCRRAGMRHSTSRHPKLTWLRIRDFGHVTWVTPPNAQPSPHPSRACRVRVARAAERENSETPDPVPQRPQTQCRRDPRPGAAETPDPVPQRPQTRCRRDPRPGAAETPDPVPQRPQTRCRRDPRPGAAEREALRHPRRVRVGAAPPESVESES